MRAEAPLLPSARSRRLCRRRQQEPERVDRSPPTRVAEEVHDHRRTGTTAQGRRQLPVKQKNRAIVCTIVSRHGYRTWQICFCSTEFGCYSRNYRTTSILDRNPGSTRKISTTQPSLNESTNQICETSRGSGNTQEKPGNRTQNLTTTPPEIPVNYPGAHGNTQRRHEGAPPSTPAPVANAQHRPLSQYSSGHRTKPHRAAWGRL